MFETRIIKFKQQYPDALISNCGHLLTFDSRSYIIYHCEKCHNTALFTGFKRYYLHEVIRLYAYYPSYTNELSKYMMLFTKLKSFGYYTKIFKNKSLIYIFNKMCNKKLIIFIL